MLHAKKKKEIVIEFTRKQVGNFIILNFDLYFSLSLLILVGTYCN